MDYLQQCIGSGENEDDAVYMVELEGHCELWTPTKKDHWIQISTIFS